MADTLKSLFDRAMIARLAAPIARVYPSFQEKKFLAEATRGLEALELVARGQHVGRVLAEHLPKDFEEAARIIVASLGPPLPETGSAGFEPFRYLPFVCFIMERGVEHLEASLAAQHALTKRFTAEWSIRVFIERYEDQVLARLAEWARDPDPHVRRLVSEGTRPRLPWASRLRRFQEDPRPVLALLELLRDDPSLYVRRSVANNLNDIGKDHPELLVEVCARWSKGATPERRWLIEHALRSAVKRGHPGALAVLGHGAAPKVELTRAAAAPRRVRIGERVVISLELASTASKKQALLVDLGVHFVKARGDTSVKVFKLKRVDLEPRGRVELSKSISLAVHTTRRPFPGKHRFDVRVNGTVLPGADFVVIG